MTESALTPIVPPTVIAPPEPTVYAKLFTLMLGLVRSRIVPSLASPE